ncbi:synaptic vesicle 2-related protein-like [Brachionichthys hirsutus]|uniref:synaptic vesicle 2-related protein-like n=1 Tax=Brachionichthys hirsutus TaxID=412623 RepID=UPI003604A086
MEGQCPFYRDHRRPAIDLYSVSIDASSQSDWLFMFADLLRGGEQFVGQSYENKGADNEEGKPASRSRSDKTWETFTVQDALETFGFGKFQLKLCILTGLAWTGEAVEMVILSILGPQLHCEWRLPTYEVALIALMLFVGMIIGSPLWGNVFDKLGRRVGLISSMCWTLFYGLLSAFAPAYTWVLLLRGLVGFGIAGCSQSVTLYSEFLPIKMKGPRIMIMKVFWSFGTVMEVLLAIWIMPRLGWRWLLGVSVLPKAIFVCFSFWLPESPHFDLMAGNTEKVMLTLQRVAKENGQTMLQGKVIPQIENNRGQIKDLFAPQYWRATLLLWFIWFAAAFSYYGLILLTTELFQSGDPCGRTQRTEDEHVCFLECQYLTLTDYKDLLWTTLAEFPGVLFFLLMVDRIGRKISLALCFFMFSLFILPLHACVGRVVLTIFIFIARAFIAGGFQLVFVYTPQVFPIKNRALAVGTCNAVGRAGSLVTPFVSEVMLRKSFNLTLSAYFVCSLLAGIACLMLPNKTLSAALQESKLDNEDGVQTNLCSASLEVIGTLGRPPAGLDDGFLHDD